jgi:hypothetical protein
MKITFKRIILILGLISFLPVVALADAGTPLMWLNFFHLVIGNALIGILEGFILTWIFKTNRARSIKIMILANYVSMILGMVGIIFFNYYLRNIISINNIKIFFFVFLIGSFIATIFIEWPFCFWIMKNYDNRRNQSFKASLILQSISYIVIMLLYFSTSRITLMTKVKVDNTLSFLKTTNAWVYYISPNDGTIYKIQADGTLKQKVVDTKINDPYARLFIRYEDGKIKLGFYKIGERLNILVDNLSGYALDTMDFDEKYFLGWHSHTSADFRLDNKQNWKVYTGNWAIEGMVGENEKKKEKMRLALETPFFIWPMKQASMLPEDQVICEIDYAQIALVDLNERKIGLITFGRSPVVVLENTR